MSSLKRASKNPESKSEAEQRRRVFRPVPASFVFVFDDNAQELLLHRRQNTHFLDGYLDAPGGHEDPGETPKVCAIRELEEETKLVFDLNELTLFAIHTAIQPEIEYRYSGYFIKGLKGQIPIIGEAKNCSEIGMFNVKELLRGEVPDLSPIVARLLQGYIDFSESGVVSEMTYELNQD